MPVAGRNTLSATGCSTTVAVTLTLSEANGFDAKDERFNLVIIPDGAYLSEGVAVRNIAATTTAKKGFWFDEFAFRHELPGDRTGFSFV